MDNNTYPRRAFLQGAVASAATPVALAASPGTSSASQVAPVPSPISPLKTAKIRSEFLSTGTAVWSDFPSVLDPLESTATAAINSANEKDNPYLASSRMVEIHLGIARTKLDQCFALRQNAHEIEIDACKAIWNRQVVKVRADSDGGFEDNYYTHLQYARAEQYDEPQKEVAGKNTPSTYFELIRTALGNRRGVTVQYEDALNERRQLLYSGFNYVQRHEALRMRFTDALVDAYLRCRACVPQLKNSFAIEKAFPTTVDLGKGSYLEGLSNWLNQVLLDLERALIRDVQTEVSFWLRADSAGMTWVSNALTVTTGTFTVPSLSQFVAPRLLGMSVSVILNADQLVPSEFSIVMSPPGVGMKVPGVARVVNTKFYQEPVQIRSNVLANIDPTAAAWTLEIANNGIGRPSTVKHTAIADILVSMRVAGRSPA